MATATQLAQAAADSLGITHSAAEAYALALRKHGWWEPTKRGRGASPATDSDGGKYLLSFLSTGPSDLPSFFLDYANLCVVPNAPNREVVDAIRDELGLPADAAFLDFIIGFVRLFREQATDRVIFYSPSPPGFMEPYFYDGPDLDLRVKGPFPIASIRLLLSHSLADRLVEQGADREALLGPQTIAFVHQLYGWADEQRALGQDVENYSNAIAALREQHSRGVGFERFIGGREFDAIGKALRGDST